MDSLRQGSLAHLAVHVAIGAGIVLAAGGVAHLMRSAGLERAAQQLAADPAAVYSVLMRWRWRVIGGAFLLQVAVFVAAGWVQSRTRWWQAQTALGLVVAAMWFAVVALTTVQLRSTPALQHAFQSYWNAPSHWTIVFGDPFSWTMFLDQRLGIPTLVTSVLLFGVPQLLGALGGEYVGPGRQSRRSEVAIVFARHQVTTRGTWVESENRTLGDDGSDQ